ncbi:6218_t:CDS:2, partial [Funneliformis geosporum]
SARHVLAMDAFANKSTLAFLKTYCGEDIRIIDNRYQLCVGKMVEFIYDSNSRAETMQIGYEFLKQGKRMAFISTGAVIARAVMAYYGDIDGRQRQKDFSDINVTWDELDCVTYTNTVKAGISFEVTDYFDIVIAITNIATPVHVEALVQMLYQIHD